MVPVNSAAPVWFTGFVGLGRVILASGSARRLELLRSAGIEPVVMVPDIDETSLESEIPTAYVGRLAEAKAGASGASEADLVIAADTAVELDGRIIGKPVDDQDAAGILGKLSGRQHTVHTGLAVSRLGRCEVRVVSTKVRFADLDDRTIDWYVGTGEPVGKAGAYAIQGSGACLVVGVTGSVSNVIGLPLAELREMLGVGMDESG